jgi:TPR repeat protein
MKEIIIALLLSCFVLTVFATPEVETTIQGIKAYQAGNYSKALELLTKASNAGNPNASGVLSQMYYNEQGVKQDYKKGFKLISFAASKGFPDAIYGLGQYYYFGNGISQDKKKAIKFYTNAANSGYGEAQSKLGAIYETGCNKTCSMNFPLAIYWFTLAEMNGNKDAKDNYFEVKKSEFESKLPYCIALGQDNVAQAYYQGIGGLSKSTREAVTWLEKAHHTDPSLGVVNLDLAKMQHNNGNDGAAFKAASEAVSQPYAPAFQYLGTMYQNGIGTDKNSVKAYAYLAVAVELYKNPDDVFYNKFAAPCMPNYKQTTGEFNLGVAQKQLSGINLTGEQKKEAEKMILKVKGWKK